MLTGIGNIFEFEYTCFQTDVETIYTDGHSLGRHNVLG